MLTLLDCFTRVNFFFYYDETQTGNVNDALWVWFV